MASPGVTTFPALGTTATVIASDVGRLLEAVAVVRDEVDEIDRACSRFRTDSDLARLHGSPDRWTTVSPALFEAVEVALGAARATDGAVDPTVGDAVRRMGYDRDFARIAPTGPQITSRPAPGWRVVETDPERCAIRLPAGVLLDLGATAKASAADGAAARAVAVTGVGVLVSLGGDLAAFGDAPAGGWTVSISDDHRDAIDNGEVVSISSGGLATSSTTVRRWMRGGMPVHHVVDPMTGRPAAEVWRTVSVTAARCVDANTATTAAIVLGERAVGWIRALGLPARLVRADGRIVRLCGWPEAVAAWPVGFLDRVTSALVPDSGKRCRLAPVVDSDRRAGCRERRPVVSRAHPSVRGPAGPSRSLAPRPGVHRDPCGDDRDRRVRADPIDRRRRALRLGVPSHLAGVRSVGVRPPPGDRHHEPAPSSARLPALAGGPLDDLWNVVVAVLHGAGVGSDRVHPGCWGWSPCRSALC